MTDVAREEVEELMATVREAFDGGVPLLYAEDRKARRDIAEAALSRLHALLLRAGDPRILPAGEVCSCLDETGERLVRPYEQCLRCGTLMVAIPEETKEAGNE